MAEPGTIRPDPDPTVRTVDLVVERVSSLEKLISAKLVSVVEMQQAMQEKLQLVETRLTSLDVKSQLIGGELKTVNTVINLMKDNTKDIGDLVAKALDAALKAATDTNDRVERATMEQIKQLRDLLDRGIVGLSSKVDTAIQGVETRASDLKEIVNNAQGVGSGVKLAAAAVAGLVGIAVGLIAGWRM
jgi:methyl-accepting chemotaxis protein